MVNGADISIRPTVYYVSETVTYFKSSTNHRLAQGGAVGLQPTHIYVVRLSADISC